MSYDNNLQVIVGKVVSDNTKAPTLRVNLEIDGVKYQAGLWPWKRKDGSMVKDKQGNQQYIGTLEVDTYRQDQNIDQAAAGTSSGVPFDDDIPFAPFKGF